MADERHHITVDVTDGINDDPRVLQTFRFPWPEDEPAPDVIITGDLMLLVLWHVDAANHRYQYRKAECHYISEPSWWLAQTKEATAHV